MKKALSLTLTLLLALGCAFGLTACGFGSGGNEGSVTEQAYRNTTKFAFKGGPGADYSEYYFDGSDAFRIYTPYNTGVANRTDGYYKKNSDGSYTCYVKQSDGSWKTERKSANDYKNVVKSVKAMYLAFLEDSVDFTLSEAEKEEASVSVYVYTENDGVYTANIGGMAFSYYDIELLVISNDDGKPFIKSATWKMKYASAIYNMSLVTEGVDITFPEVEE